MKQTDVSEASQPSLQLEPIHNFDRKNIVHLKVKQPVYHSSLEVKSIIQLPNNSTFEEEKITMNLYK